MNAPDDVTALPARFPSPIEIVGIVAGVVPFTFSMASTSMMSENGVVTSFTYRDPVAIAGGIVAALCGLIAIATLLRKTEPAKRTLRIILCIALIGGGAFQALRGFGIVGIDKPAVSESSSVTTSIPPVEPPVATAKTDDVLPAVQKLVTLWKADKIDDVFALAQAEVQAKFDKFDLRHVHDTFAESFGALEKTGELVVKTEDNLIRVEGPAVCAKATLNLKITFAREGSELRWRGFTFEIPKDLQREPADAEGDAFARKALDLILAKKFDTAMFHPRLVDRTPADIEEKLAAVLDEFGPIKTIGTPVVRECPETRCVTFAVAGKKQKGTFKADLLYGGYVWRISSWNLEHE